jgi:hypothetical protein
MSKRTHITLSEPTRLLLCRMASVMDTTMSGAIAMSLAYTSLALREQGQGNAIGAIRGERVVKELVAPWGEVVGPEVQG